MSNQLIYEDDLKYGAAFSCSLYEKVRKVILKNCSHSDWIFKNCILLHIAGSRLYGTNTENSDYDIRGITIAPKDYWVGASRFDQFEYKDDDIDIVIYDVRKWIKLAVAMNPNVIESLFARSNYKSMFLHSRQWDNIDNKMQELINQAAYSGYKGYSSAQLKKMAVKQSNKSGRREIAEEYGFDLKFASHGFRLIRQGAELLETGKITFPRPDRQNLLDIRYGKIYGPTEIDKCIKDWEKEQQILDEALVNSVLPVKANFKEYNDLLVSIFDDYVG